MTPKNNRIPNLTIRIYDHNIDQVESFRYLSSIISQNGKCAMEINQAKTAFINKRNLL